jgi:hypothetical protein
MSETTDLAITTQDGIVTINARDLHAGLGVSRDFSTWIKERINKFCLEEGKDYMKCSPNMGSGLDNEYSPNLGKTSDGGRPQIDYYLIERASLIICAGTNKPKQKEFLDKLSKTFEAWNSKQLVEARNNQLNGSIQPKLEIDYAVLANHVANHFNFVVDNTANQEEIAIKYDLIQKDVEDLNKKIDRSNYLMKCILTNKKVKFPKDKKQSSINISDYKPEYQLQIKRLINTYADYHFNTDPKPQPKQNYYKDAYRIIYNVFDTIYKTNIYMIYKEEINEKKIDKAEYPIIQFIEDQGYINDLYRISLANLSVI